MRRILLLTFLAATGLTAGAQQLEWFTDAQVALDRAKQENKEVLLDFTGSDWCGWCMKLKSEVFDQPEFAQYARANLVLVEVDFPRHKLLDPAQKQANYRLADAFGITGYPTIVILNQNGQVIGRTGYRPGGPSTFNAELDGIITRAGQSRPAARPQAPTVPDSPPAPRRPLTMPRIAPPPVVHYGNLALKGISGTKDRKMALINNAVLMVGETASVKTGDTETVVTVKEIRDDSVLITADDKPMELKLKSP